MFIRNTCQNILDGPFRYSTEVSLLIDDAMAVAASLLYLFLHLNQSLISCLLDLVDHQRLSQEANCAVSSYSRGSNPDIGITYVTVNGIGNLTKRGREWPVFKDWQDLELFG